jgi:hypothetical protein
MRPGSRMLPGRPQSITNSDHVTDVVTAARQAGTRPQQYATFAMIADPDVPERRWYETRAATLMVNGVPRQPDNLIRHHAENGIALAYIPPGDGQVFSTWSHYADERGLCAIEGEFYGETCGSGSATGFDARLARDVLDRVTNRGPEALDELNGLFSGFVYARQSRSVLLFVDRVGGRFLYYRAGANRCEATTSIYGFRSTDPPPVVDPQGLNEHLVFGYPMESRTLFSGIHLVKPGIALEWRAGRTREHCYLRWPRRQGGRTLTEQAEAVSQALDRHLKSQTPTSPEAHIALSGGKDSRGVLSALLRADYRVYPVTFLSGAADVPNAFRVAQATRLPLRVIAPPGNPGLLDADAALLSNGSGGSDFLLLALAAALGPSPVIFTGFCGDMFSGSWSGFRPWRMRTLDSMALAEYQIRRASLPPSLTRAVLRPDLVVPDKLIIDAIVSSYSRLDTGDLLSTYILHRLMHRNRRVNTHFHHMRAFSAPRHPFVDRDVVNCYLTLPLESVIGQPVHCVVAGAWTNLGSIPAGVSWLPLRYELLGCRWLERAKHAWRPFTLRRTSISRTRSNAALPLNAVNERRLTIGRESGLFDPRALDALRGDLASTPGATMRLSATSIHVAAVTGTSLPSAAAPVFMRT